MYEVLIRYKPNDKIDISSPNCNPGFFQTFVASETFQGAVESALSKLENDDNKFSVIEIIVKSIEN